MKNTIQKFENFLACEKPTIQAIRTFIEENNHPIFNDCYEINEGVVIKEKFYSNSEIALLINK